MSVGNEEGPGALVVVTRNRIAHAVEAMARLLDRPVTVLGNDDAQGTPRERLPLLRLTSRDAVVLTDHDAPQAYDMLRDAVRSDAGYVAMLASRQRSADVLAMLRDEGFAESPLRRLHMPAGLDLGGKRPEEIALSVVAEILAWSNGRVGGPMRQGVAP